MKLHQLIQAGQLVGYMFHCPGCESGHGVWTENHNSRGAKWTFNGNLERPSFSPSLMIDHGIARSNKRHVCHSFITDGQIQFLSDCTHPLAGKTVDIPDWEGIE